MPAAEQAPPSNPLVAALRSGEAPRPVKLSAARGVLPISRGELAGILVPLTSDTDEEIRTAAEATLAGYPSDEVYSLLMDQVTDATVLHYFACGASAKSFYKEAVIVNPSTTDETLRELASGLTSQQIDEMLLNQTRLIKDPIILERLEANGQLTPLQRTRIDEIRHHFLRMEPASPRAARPTREDDLAAERGEIPAAPPAAAGAAGEPAVDESWESVEGLDPELAANALQQIRKMNTAQKIHLALKGSREERTILIKDASRSVQEAVIDSPKITQGEVESIAKMRSVAEEILRVISITREWTKSYGVTHALATNPKTPAGIALGMLARLNVRDLKILAGDKNVSEVIRRQAKKFHDARTQPARSSSRH